MPMFLPCQNLKLLQVFIRTIRACSQIVCKVRQELLGYLGNTAS